MGTRFGRRAADGTYEYHDSKESLVAAERRDSSDARSGLFGLIGLLVGGVLTYIVLIKVGTDWPKWLRFGLVIAGAGGLAYVLAKFADLIWNIILSLVLLACGASARGSGRRCSRGHESTRSSGNVFADLGLPDADVLNIKSGLAIDIKVAIRDLGLSRGGRRAHGHQRRAARQPGAQWLCDLRRAGPAHLARPPQRLTPEKERPHTGGR
jgi:hypothetical protein